MSGLNDCLEKAERCRELAASIPNPHDAAVQHLNSLAVELEIRAVAQEVRRLATRIKERKPLSGAKL